MNNIPDKGERRYSFDVYHKGDKGYLAPVSVSVCDFSDIDAFNRIRKETPKDTLIKVKVA